MLLPGEAAALEAALRGGRLCFTTDGEEALRDADVLWVASAAGNGDEALEQLYGLFRHLRDGMLVFLSTPLRAGTVRRVAEVHEEAFPGRSIHFGCHAGYFDGRNTVEMLLRRKKVGIGVRSMEGLAAARTRGKRIEGLLLNSRMVQATFDDLKPETRGRWAYPDTKKWEPERNTREFVAAMAAWISQPIPARKPTIPFR